MRLSYSAYVFMKQFSGIIMYILKSRKRMKANRLCEGFGLSTSLDHDDMVTEVRLDQGGCDGLVNG